ncbi:MAG: tetratricopeptide repeat protein, partial [Actinomycetota bacterium]|nr:tetratricopeptide repeat protein [Actinomycetota bacterium]
ASGLVALSSGDLPSAVAHGTKAASVAPRPDQSLGVAALAAAHQGDLDEAFALADRLATAATSPTIQGFAHYVVGEIDTLAGRMDQAEQRYQQAILLTRKSGATFVDGIASVGLLTVLARAGRLGEALDGYLDLIGYWERTGGWIQQWTTLRNLGRLLRALGDPETALFLEAAAHSAPDAPAFRGVSDEPDAGALPPDRVRDIRADAATASRARVLEVARQAVDRHRAVLEPA